MPVRFDSWELFEKFKNLDLTRHKTQIARDLGLHVQRLYELLKMWDREGVIRWDKESPGSPITLVEQPEAIRTPVRIDSDACPDRGESGPPLTSQSRSGVKPRPPLTSQTAPQNLTSQSRTRAGAQKIFREKLTAFKLRLNAGSLAGSLGHPRNDAEHARETQFKSAAKFKLDDGSKVLTRHIWMNANRLTRGEVARLLDAPPVFLEHRKAMLDQFGKTFKKVYISKWSEATGRAKRQWMDVADTPTHFKKAAEIWAREFVERGMTMEEFLDAARELCPMALKFPRPNMLASSFGMRIAEWVPPSERQSKKVQTWKDGSGKQWIETEDGPVQILN